MTANDRQVGGTHYQTKGKQHWDLMVEYDVPYLEAQASKYLVRWQSKGSPQMDLDKVQHYVEKLIEWITNLPPNKHHRRPDVNLDDIQAISDDLDLDVGTDAALCFILRWNTLADLRQVLRIVDKLRAGTIPAPGTPEDGGHHEPR